MGAVLFDLDGTLLDTLPGICAALNAALSRLSYPPVDEQRTRALIGDGALRLCERACPAGGDVRKLYEIFRAEYDGLAASGAKPYDGIAALLSSLKERGTKLAVVTNKPQSAAELCVRAHFGDVFDFVGGDDGTFPRKPDPTLARFAALTMRVPLFECVFAGDGETDVLTAKRAGMVCVSVLWGYRCREVLEAAGAKLFARTPDELGKILEKLS